MYEQIELGIFVTPVLFVLSDNINKTNIKQNYKISTS